jgi:hypothetical protein
MLYPIMLLGIGFLTACIMMAMLAPLIHERAVRLTVRRLASRRSRSAIDRRAHEDQLRARFAVSIRRLETAAEDAQAKAAGQLCDVARNLAEIPRLKTELRRKNLVILRFQARELMRRSTVRTIIKLLVYLLTRAQRQAGRARPAPAFRGRAVGNSKLESVSASTLSRA